MDFMNEPRYAWSDAPGHVLVSPYGQDAAHLFGFPISQAKEVYAQLGKAIEQAEQTPFLRWWLGLSVRSIDGSTRFISQESNVHLTKAEAEALFNQIRSAQ